MKIEDIDKNLRVETNLDLPEMKWLTPLDAPLSLYGIHAYTEDKGYIRMPLDVAEATSEGVGHLAAHTAGGRIRFRTDSSRIAVKVYLSSDQIMTHITAIGQAGLDVYTLQNGSYNYHSSIHPVTRKDENGLFSYEGLIRNDGTMRSFTLNMPLYSDVRAIYLGFRPNAQIEKAEEYTISKPVLYYGSSITQGGCASRPGNAYQGVISRRFDCDFINLGFSGSARGEQTISDYLASLDPSVFVLDYDYNAPDPAHLRATHEPLFKNFRAAHPETPVIMVTCPDYRNTPDLVERREIIRTTYRNAVDAGDKNVYYIDGATLFEGDFRDSCTVDGCHPNDLGFYRMAKVIGDVMAPIMEKLK